MAFLKEHTFNRNITPTKATITKSNTQHISDYTPRVLDPCEKVQCQYAREYHDMNIITASLQDPCSHFRLLSCQRGVSFSLAYTKPVLPSTGKASMSARRRIVGPGRSIFEHGGEASPAPG